MDDKWKGETKILAKMSAVLEVAITLLEDHDMTPEQSGPLAARVLRHANREVMAEMLSRGIRLTSMVGDEPPLSRTRAKGITRGVIDAVREATPRGLTAKEVAERFPHARWTGTLLSRMKGQGLLTYDGERYRAVPS